jgi:hypothetical protein
MDWILVIKFLFLEKGSLFKNVNDFLLDWEVPDTQDKTNFTELLKVFYFNFKPM